MGIVGLRSHRKKHRQIRVGRKKGVQQAGRQGGYYRSGVLRQQLLPSGRRFHKDACSIADVAALTNDLFVGFHPHITRVW